MTEFERDRETAQQAIIRVSDGRGFIVEGETHLSGDRDRYVITAAHCLPDLPPAHPAAYTEELTYKDLLGPLGQEPTVWAECAFVDPIADIAVLISPDNQALSDQADAFEELIFKRPALTIAEAPAQDRKQVELEPDNVIEVDTPGEGDVHVLSLDGKWVAVRVRRRRGWLSIEPEKRILPGMSGSPVMLAGAAIGLLSFDIRSPTLIDNLPTRLVRAIHRS